LGDMVGGGEEWVVGFDEAGMVGKKRRLDETRCDGKSMLTG
jgi:hypothetical protein